MRILNSVTKVIKEKSLLFSKSLMTLQRRLSEKDILELEKLGINRSLIDALSAEEARDLLRALRFVLQKYRDARETETASPA